MALTGFQLAVCRLIARRRVADGESYVAGGGSPASDAGPAAHPKTREVAMNVPGSVFPKLR